MWFLMDVTLGDQVHLPLLSLIGAIGLLVVSVIVSWRLASQVTMIERALRRADEEVENLTLNGAGQIDEDRLGKLAEIFEQSPLFARTWAKYRRSLLLDGSAWYDSPRIYGTQPAGAVFTEEALFSRLNLPFYRSFAAMLTGAGLLLTFLAFFIGLSKIQFLGGTISGLPGLINGLSGKFVTSIVGLACASVFVIFEKGLFHRLILTYHGLVDRVDQVFPYRGSTEWLFEMSQHHAEQTRLLKYLSLDLAQHFRKSLTDTMATPLVDLAGAVRQLRTGVSTQLPMSASEVHEGHARRKLAPPAADHGGAWDQLSVVFDRLEASAIRQEQLMTRLADILVPWTEISPKGRLALSNVGRSPTKPVSLPVSRHSA
ncbi:MAG TPA: hypothetical protein VGJ57_03245 [Nitrospirales bacterium]|jgi:hypothetical protein